MPPSAQAHQRSHSLLLLQKLLNLRDTASPFTVILDSLEQTAWPLLREFMGRAKIARSKVVFVSFSTLKKPRDVDVFVNPRGKSLKVLAAEVASHCTPAATATAKVGPSQRTLIVIDALNPLAEREPSLLAGFLSGLITQTASVVAVYHTDVPLVLPRSFSEYDPEPLTLLLHLATTIFRVSSLYQEVEKKKAQNRSLPEPEWGLREGREGVLIGLRNPEHDKNLEGVVVEMEMRRRSGRAVTEKFVLAKSPGTNGVAAAPSISLLSDHPLFAPTSGEEGTTGDADGGDDMNATFSLGLTDKQRRDREGVVLPYFDAQTDIGGGEGGRILYEMGREDDFDDEEDEI